MKKRFILLIILFLGVASTTNPFTPLESSAAPSIAFFDDFEGSLSWNTTGFWHREDNASSSYPSYGIPSPTHFMWYGQNNTGDYNNSNTNFGSLTSAPIDLSDYSGNINLSFWSWSDTEYSNGSTGIYDLMLVYISVDGGSTWNLRQNMSDNPIWNYYSFDISSYGRYSDVRIQFYFDTIDPESNDYHGWLIDNVMIEGDYNPPTDDFALWIEQENYAKVGETKNMTFFIDSFFSFGKTVNITVLLDTPTQTNFTFYQSWFVYISPYGSWNTTLDIYFEYAGFYDVWFIVTDGSSNWSEWCWWEVSDDGYFDLWVEQESTAFVGQEKWMDFYLESYYSSGKWVNITIVITPETGYNETLFEKSYVFIGAYEKWHLSLPYKFPIAGTHYVNFMVFDEYGTKWDVYCPWFVDAEGFDLWIDQDYISFIGKEEKMYFHAEVFYNRSFEAYVNIFIQTPTYHNITLFNDYVPVSPNEPYWETKYTLGFNETGIYTVYFIVMDDKGVYWIDMCYWEVLTEGLDLTIIQENFALPGEEKWMTFMIDSYYDYSVMFNTTIEMYGPDGSVIIEKLDYEYIEAHGHWEISVPYTFNEVGHYDVYFMVEDEVGYYWDAWCCWDVQKKNEYLDLKIEQEFNANPGDPVWMSFFVESYFSHSMYVYVEIFIEGPNEFNHTIFSGEIFLENNTGWAYKLNDYVFEDPGFYLVHMVVTDDIGKKWYAECKWDIGEVEPTAPWIDVDAPSSADVNEEFYVSADIYAGSNDSLIIYALKITLENGTVLHYHDFGNYSLSAGAYETHSTFLQIPTEGQYVIYVSVDTSKGILQAKFTIEISTPPEDKDTDTEPRIESSPGFEGIFMLSALVMLPVLLQKRRR